MLKIVVLIMDFIIYKQLIICNVEIPVETVKLIVVHVWDHQLIVVVAQTIIIYKV